MPTNSDYRKYLELRFDTLTTLVNAQAKVTHEWLEKLEAHAERTNGRVHELEDKLTVVEKDLLTHPIKCDKAKDIDVIEAKVEEVVKDLEEYRIFKKYPKLIAILIAVFVVGICISAYGAFKSVHNGIFAKEIINEVKDMRDWVEFSAPILNGQKYSPTVRSQSDSLKTK